MSKPLITMALLAVLSGVPALANAQPFDPVKMADKNKDGTISLEEFEGFREMGWNFASQGSDKIEVAKLSGKAKNVVRGVKPDAGGFVSHAAFTASAEAAYSATDTDHDGKVSGAELRAWVEGE